MAEVASGFRWVLSNPIVYETYQFLVGGRNVRRALATAAAPSNGDAILDLGCGPGSLFAYIPDGASYLGVDLSARYVEEAKRVFGARGEFICGDATNVELGNRKFEIVCAIGLLHHLDDAKARDVVGLARSVLRPGGRFLSVDACFADGQTRLSRLVVRMDRGQNVRNPEGYRELAQAHFANVTSVVRHDLLRIPFTACMLTCTL